jgi:hypothetical protein
MLDSLGEAFSDAPLPVRLCLSFMAIPGCLGLIYRG